MEESFRAVSDAFDESDNNFEPSETLLSMSMADVQTYFKCYHSVHKNGS